VGMIVSILIRLAAAIYFSYSKKNSIKLKKNGLGNKIHDVGLHLKYTIEMNI
jgi:hypothetical protein